MTVTMFFMLGGILLGGLGVIVGSVLGGIAALIMGKDTIIKKIQAKCLESLRNSMNSAYTEICVKADPITKVEEIRREIKTKSENALKQVYDEKKQAVDERVKALTEQIQADAQQHQQKQAELTALRTAWKPIHSNLTELKQNIEQLEKDLQIV